MRKTDKYCFLLAIAVSLLFTGRLSAQDASIVQKTQDYIVIAKVSPTDWMFLAMPSLAVELPLGNNFSFQAEFGANPRQGFFGGAQGFVFRPTFRKYLLSFDDLPLHSREGLYMEVGVHIRRQQGSYSRQYVEMPDRTFGAEFRRSDTAGRMYSYGLDRKERGIHFNLGYQAVLFKYMVIDMYAGLGLSIASQQASGEQNDYTGMFATKRNKYNNRYALSYTGIYIPNIQLGIRIGGILGKHENGDGI